MGWSKMYVIVFYNEPLILFLIIDFLINKVANGQETALLLNFL